jgi:hypothetical protein
VRGLPAPGRRAAAFAVVLAGLLAYFTFHRSLPDLGRDADLAFLALALIPATFALVGLALPIRRWRGLLPVGLALAVLAAACEVGDLETAANFAKLAAVTCLGFWFLSLFETIWWAVTVALIVPWVDAYSVWRGPTRHIVEKREEVFTTLSFAFPVWGDRGAANLGLPDLLFFAVFLAAAARWELRVFATWLCMALSFGATLAIAVYGDVNGLPALPLLCLGFLGPNVDILWRRWRERRALVPQPREP